MIVGVLKQWLRMAAKAPLPTIAIILILTISVAAITTIFTIVNGILLKPLPFPEPERLVALPQFDKSSGHPLYTSISDFLEYEKQVQELESIAAYGAVSFSFGDGGLPEPVRGCVVTKHFFSSLKVGAAQGRTFGDEDADGATVISDSLWRRRYGGAAIVGKPVTLDASPALIVGVMPRDFRFPENKCDIWRLMTLEYNLLRNHPNYHFLRCFGRLKHGVTVEQVRAHLEVVDKALVLTHADTVENLRISAFPLSQYVVRDLRPFLLALMAATTFLLLIAWANVANLQLIRSVSRQKELSIRLALGADRLRVALQLLLESLLLTVPSWILGLGLAEFGVRVALELGPAAVSRSPGVVIDAKVLGFAFGISIIPALLFSLILLSPAISPASVVSALNDSGRTSTMSRKTRLAQTLLVIVEIALSLALLVNADLVIRSLIKLSVVDVGFRTGDVLRATLRLQRAKYENGVSLDNFQQRVYATVAQIPGVELVVGTSDEPLTSWFEDFFAIKGYPDPSPEHRETIAQASVSPNYFHVMGIRLLAGREITEFDRPQTEPVAVINEMMARRYWPSGGALGSHVRHGVGDPVKWYRVVGIVADSRPLQDWEPVPKIYTPFLQSPVDADDHFKRPVTLMVVTHGKPADFTLPLRDALGRLDPTLGVEVQPMEDIISSSLAPPKFRALLFGSLSLITLALTIFGIYGVISSFVGTQTREISIRMALGATPRSVLMLFVRKGVLTTTTGLLVGTILSFSVTPELQSVLYGIKSTDPVAFLSAFVLLSVASLSATYLAASKAVRVDPALALSYE
jgi:putative ABC transport system permease protein